MFGYLRVRKCGLEEYDRKLYSSHFCSVCHHLSQNAGWDASILTNYDVTLWNIVASGVSASCYTMSVEKRPCTVVPFRKVWVQPLTTEVGASLSAITVLLVWAKLEDSQQDGSRVVSKLGKLWLGSKERKAESYLRGLGYPVDTLLEIPVHQKRLESSDTSSLSILSSPTTEALSEAFAWIGHLANRTDLEARLRRLGGAIAGFIYLWDAVDDLESDRNKGCFNAVTRVWGHEPKWNEVRSMLTDYLESMEGELRVLPLGDRRPICLKLVESLRGKVSEHPKLRVSSRSSRPLLRRQAEAGFVRAQSGCCDCGCCDCGCCDGGGDGCHCCEASCCDTRPGDSCCEFSCSNCCCPCSGDSGCCCCDRDSGGNSCGDSSTTTTCDFCCCFSDSDNTDHNDSDSKKRKQNDSGVAEPKRPLLLCPGCRCDLVYQDKGTYRVHSCEGCRAAWVEQQSYEAAVKAGRESLLQEIQKGEASSPISRGQRMCPLCTTLLRSPADREAPESCTTCGGRFYCPSETA